MLLARIPDTRLSVEILLVLFVILIASSATFWLLNRRWTSHRQWVTLAEWARNAGFRLERCEPGRLPVPLDTLASTHSPVVRLCLRTRGSILVQVQSDEGPRGAATTAPASPVVWNLAVRDLEGTWPPTGLRPVPAVRSLLDLFSLSSFPLLGGTERFVLFGTEPGAAATLSRSMARSLLPPDVGLLLHGRTLTLDFSDRPFDTLELDRMLALGEQLAQKLPLVDRR